MFEEQADYRMCKSTKKGGRVNPGDINFPRVQEATHKEQKLDVWHGWLRLDGDRIFVIHFKHLYVNWFSVACYKMHMSSWLDFNKQNCLWTEKN